jgi:glutamate--cysteine ligase
MNFAPHVAREDIARAFAPGGACRIGVEVEALVARVETGRPAQLAETLDALARGASRRAWRVGRSATYGLPELRLDTGGRLSFEPGGQLEYSSPVFESPSTLLNDVGGVFAAVRDALEDAGLQVRFSGLDSETPVADVPMQLDAERYRRMEAYFASIGPAGARMMRQSASVHVCVDAGERPLERWRLLSALAPLVAAAFANSPEAPNGEPGWRSARRRVWAELDAARTGLRALGADPIGEYLDFALRAPAFLLDPQPRAEPFEAWLGRGATRDDWRTHLTTLFPDVRPRGYFELRAADSVEGDALAALVLLVWALARDARSGANACEALPEPNASLMHRAGRRGLADPVLAAAARDVTPLAVRAAESAPASLLKRTDAQRAAAFFETVTLRGLAPGDRAPAAAP